MHSSKPAAGKIFAAKILNAIRTDHILYVIGKIISFGVKLSGCGLHGNLKPLDWLVVFVRIEFLLVCGLIVNRQ